MLLTSFLHFARYLGDMNIQKQIMIAIPVLHLVNTQSQATIAKIFLAKMLKKVI